MATVKVKEGETLETALKRFKRMSSEITRDAKKQSGYVKPGVARKEKQAEARKRAAIANKKRKRASR